jgi:hypothetical protein
MARVRRATIPIDELLAYLFAGDQVVLAAEVRRWSLASRAFRAFTEVYRDKIRKKARGSRDGEAQRDLAFELAIVARLLEDRRFAVEYEPYGIGQRAPDLRVTFRGGLRFNIEARRLRRLASVPTAAVSAGQLDRTVCDKLGQLPPGMLNLLVLGADDPASAALVLTTVTRRLEDGVAHKDEALFQRRGLTGTRDFLRHYRRLSGIAWFGDPLDQPPVGLWKNPQARHALPADLARTLSRLFS